MLTISGAAGMCSAARGVSAAGIPTPCFMLLFKLFTLKPAAQQITLMLNHPDSAVRRNDLLLTSFDGTHNCAAVHSRDRIPVYSILLRSEEALGVRIVSRSN